jgi:hypothetical protein
LYLFSDLTLDGHDNGLMRLEPDEAMQAIPLGEAVRLTRLMLVHPSLEIGRNADVERPVRPIGLHLDGDERATLHHGAVSFGRGAGKPAPTRLAKSQHPSWPRRPARPPPSARTAGRWVAGTEAVTEFFRERFEVRIERAA